MNDEPTLAEFESYMDNLLKLTSGQEYAETLAMLERIRLFKRERESVKEFLK